MPTAEGISTPFPSYPMQQAPVGAPLPGPGWLADPVIPGLQRYWDGQAWTAHTAPRPPSTTVSVTVAPKSVGVAFVLTFFFGAFGLLYATIPGGLIMLAVTFLGGLVVGIGTLGFGLFVWWPICWIVCVIWGCSAAGKTNTTTVRMS